MKTSEEDCVSCGASVSDRRPCRDCGTGGEDDLCARHFYALATGREPDDRACWTCGFVASRDAVAGLIRPRHPARPQARRGARPSSA